MLDAADWAPCPECMAFVVDAGSHTAWHKGLIEAIVWAARQAVREAATTPPE